MDKTKPWLKGNVTITQNYVKTAENHVGLWSAENMSIKMCVALYNEVIF